MNRSAWLLLLAVPVATARGQTSYPMISRVEPTAIRRGATDELTIAGAGDFSGASALLVEGAGLAGEVVPEKKDDAPAAKSKGAMGARTIGTTKVKLTASSDAMPGVREVRVATPQGVSTVGLVVVADDPVVTESDDKANNTPAGAQRLALPAVVSGKVGALEDVDYYAVEAKAGQTVAFALWGNRLENKIHDLQTHLDPILILSDAKGAEIASDDNHDFADPLLIHTFKDSGIFFIQVRDTNYAGNANWTYVLHVTSGPYVTSAFPMAVNPGKAAELSGLGANFDRSRPLMVDVPAGIAAGVRWFPLATDRGRSQPVPVVVTPLPIAKESGDAAGEAAKAQAVTLPAAVAGRIGERNDEDAYRFAAKKGQVYAFEVAARRAGSALDPVVRVLDLAGKVVAEVDDTPGLGKDCRLEWTAPSDADYSLQIADLHGRGGPDFGYALLAEPARPDFVATCDPDKVNIGPGARAAVFVKLTRRAGFAGPVQFAFEGLPPGVSASPLTVSGTMTQGVVVVSASADAKPAAALPALVAKAETPAGPITHPVAPIQEIYLPGGGRGLYTVGTLALGVTKPSDITVEAKPSRVVLKPGESATIDVQVTRHGGYDKAVNLAVTLGHLGQTFASPLPPGVTVREGGSKTLLGPKETAGRIVLQAAADAPPSDKVPIAVMGHVSINFVVKTGYASAPILVTVPGNPASSSKE